MGSSGGMAAAHDFSAFWDLESRVNSSTGPAFGLTHARLRNAAGWKFTPAEGWGTARATFATVGMCLGCCCLLASRSVQPGWVTGRSSLSLQTQMQEKGHQTYMHMNLLPNGTQTAELLALLDVHT